MVFIPVERGVREGVCKRVCKGGGVGRYGKGGIRKEVGGIVWKRGLRVDVRGCARGSVRVCAQRRVYRGAHDGVKMCV